VKPQSAKPGLCGNPARGLVYHPGTFWNFGLDDKLNRHLAHFEPVKRRQNETIVASTQFISELVPAHEFGIEMMAKLKSREGVRSIRIKEPPLRTGVQRTCTKYTRLQGSCFGPSRVAWPCRGLRALHSALGFLCSR